MPTRECNYVNKETGFKCMKPFTVPSHNYRKFRCAEHENWNHDKNTRAASSRLRATKTELRTYVQDLKEDIMPDITIRLLEGINEREELRKLIEEITVPVPTLEEIIANSPELKLNVTTYKEQVYSFYDDMNDLHEAHMKKVKSHRANSLSDFSGFKNEIETMLTNKLDSFSLETEITSRMAKQILLINNRNVEYEKRIAALEKKLNGRWPSN